MRPSGGTRSLWNELQINDGWFFSFFFNNCFVADHLLCCNCFLSLIFLVFLRITRLTDMSVRKNSSIHVFKNISKMYAYCKLSLFPFFYIIHSNIFQRFILSNSPLIWNFFIFRIRSWFDSCCTRFETLSGARVARTRACVTQSQPGSLPAGITRSCTALWIV